MIFLANLLWAIVEVAVGLLALCGLLAWLFPERRD